MLTVIVGNCGSGKTLLMSILAYINHFSTKIVSNYALNFDYEELDFSKLIKSEYEDRMILIDEAYVYLESRSSSSMMNKYLSYVLFQSRKKTINMFITVQLLSTLDLRYRSMIDMIIFASNEQSFFSYLCFDVFSGKHKRINLSLEKALPFFNVYNTNEVIQSKIQNNNDISLFFESNDRKKQRISEISEKIKNEFPESKYTKNFLKKYFFENDLENYLIDMVHVYLNEK